MLLTAADFLFKLRLASAGARYVIATALCNFVMSLGCLMSVTVASPGVEPGTLDGMEKRITVL